jgi:hypothetical protein
MFRTLAPALFLAVAVAVVVPARAGPAGGELAAPVLPGPDARGHREEEPTVPLERRLRVVAFADDGRRALVVERTGVGVVADAVLVVDADGVVLRLPFGQRIADGLRGRARLHSASDLEQCTRSAEALAAVIRDFQLASVRIGMCAHPDKPILDVLHLAKPTTLSADVGRWQSRVGFAGPTFIDRHGPLVVVIGRDALGNDRLGTTTQ